MLRTWITTARPTPSSAATALHAAVAEEDGMSDNQGSANTDQTVWLVRHGPTEWSESGQHTGTTDVPLTDKGEAAAKALAPVLAKQDFARVMSSPMTRAKRTAELAGVTVDDLDSDLCEWNYGDYEGRTTPE